MEIEEHFDRFQEALKNLKHNALYWIDKFARENEELKKRIVELEDDIKWRKELDENWWEK